MKTFLVCLSTACMLLVTSVHLHAQNTDAILPASVEFVSEPIPATFTVYTSQTGSTQLDGLRLSSGNHQISELIYYVAGAMYVDVDPGSYGKWYLTMYTQHPLGYPVSELFNETTLTDVLIWKYRNESIFGYDSSLIGETIHPVAWRGMTTPPIDPEYRYFVHIGTGGPGSVTQDTLEYVSIVDYKTTWDYSNRIQLQVGIDLSSSAANGTYSTELNFEVYYQP